MSDEARSVSEAVERLSRRDPTLKWLDLSEQKHTDSQLAELADCLLAHPDVITYVYLARNQLTDETGVKLARYAATSSTIQVLSLYNNKFGSATYLAMAAVLRVNSSLRILDMYRNQPVDQARIDAAFVEALRFNPDRPIRSMWRLYSPARDFKRLKDAADELGHPSLQSLLLLLTSDQTSNKDTSTKPASGSCIMW